MCYATRFIVTVTAVLVVWGGAMLFGMNASASAEPSPSVHQVSTSSQSPGWTERLKGQTIMENAVEGRAERAALVELQHRRLIRQMQKDTQPEGDTSGAFNTTSMMHQYGAGPANGLLASNSDLEPVSMKGGAVPKNRAGTAL